MKSKIKWVILAVVVIMIVMGATIVFYHMIQEKLVAEGELTPKEYQWREKTYPKWDAMFENREYSALVQEVYAASEENHILWEWEHYDFVVMYSNIESAMEHMEKDARGNLTMPGRRLLLREQWKVKGMEIAGELTEEELTILRPIADPVLADFDTRWDFTEEEYSRMNQEFEERGSVSLDTIKEVLEEWEKRQ